MTENKKSSYQKLKEENKRLKEDIFILVNEPKSRRCIDLHFIHSRPKITPMIRCIKLGTGLLGDRPIFENNTNDRK